MDKSEQEYLKWLEDGVDSLQEQLKEALNLNQDRFEMFRAVALMVYQEAKNPISSDVILQEAELLTEKILLAAKNFAKKID